MGGEGIGEHVGEAVRCGRHDRCAERRECRGVLVVVHRGPFVAEREQDHDGHAGGDELADAPPHELAVPALEEVRDEEQHAAPRPIDLADAVAENRRDVGPATELHTEQHLDRIVEERCEIRDRRVEGEESGAQRRQLRQHPGEQRRIHHRIGHRTRLVDGDHDVTGEALLTPAMTDQLLGDERAVLGNPVTQIRLDRVRPVDVTRAGSPGARRPGQRAAHCLTCLVAQPLLDLGQHLRDHLARRGAGLVGEQLVQLDEHRHEPDVGFDRLEQLGFEQELAEVETFDGVTLQDLDDRRGEVPADVAEPADDTWLRPAEAPGPTRRTASPPIGGAAVVERTERSVDPDIVTAQVVPVTRGGPTRLSGATCLVGTITAPSPHRTGTGIRVITRR